MRTAALTLCLAAVLLLSEGASPDRKEKELRVVVSASLKTEGQAIQTPIDLPADPQGQNYTEAG